MSGFTLESLRALEKDRHEQMKNPKPVEYFYTKKQMEDIKSASRALKQ